MQGALNSIILPPISETEEAMEHDGDSDTSCSWCTWNDPQRIVKGWESFGSVHGLLRCNINAGVRTWGVDVSLRDVTIAQMGNRTTECEWRHAPEVCGGFGEFWRKLVELSWDRPQEKTVDFHWLMEALRRVHSCCRGGNRWKSQNRKNAYLSPYVEEPLNSKVIKSFVPGLRSHKCFSCFEIPMFCVYMVWTSHVHFTYSCIWLWYNLRRLAVTQILGGNHQLQLV